jgi:hypothetical protein
VPNWARPTDSGWRAFRGSNLKAITSVGVSAKQKFGGSPVRSFV